MLSDKLLRLFPLDLTLQDNIYIKANISSFTFRVAVVYRVFIVSHSHVNLLPSRKLSESLSIVGRGSSKFFFYLPEVRCGDISYPHLIGKRDLGKSFFYPKLTRWIPNNIWVPFTITFECLASMNDDLRNIV